MATNLKGSRLVANEAAQRMVAAGKRGSIVNVASILGLRVAGGVARCDQQSWRRPGHESDGPGIGGASHSVQCAVARLHRADLNCDFMESEADQKLRSRVPSRSFGSLGDLDRPLALLASDAGIAVSGACIAMDRGHLVSLL